MSTFNLFLVIVFIAVGASIWQTRRHIRRERSEAAEMRAKKDAKNAQALELNRKIEEQWLAKKLDPRARHSNVEKLLPSRSFPSADEFAASFARQLSHACHQANLQLPNPALWNSIITSVSKVYQRELPVDMPAFIDPRWDDPTRSEEHEAAWNSYNFAVHVIQLKLKDPPRILHVIQDIFVARFVDFIRLLPQSAFTKTTTPFSTPLSDGIESGFLLLSQLKPVHNDETLALGLFHNIDTGPTYRPDSQTWHSCYDLVLSRHPLHPFLRQLGSTPLPFVISEDARFFGQWIIGEPGAGKTTFISTMIAEDLKKVARNEASVFVMDSQNELIPDIARLEMFAPGRPLHDKLIYLEPNPDFPLALNIFDINKKRLSTLSSSEERMMYEAGVEWMVDFFLKSLVKSDETSTQETFLAYVIPAVLAIPNATIMTLQDLLEPAKTKGGETGYDRYQQHFGRLRPTTQKWLKDRLHSDQLKVTRDAIRSRLDGFVARGFFSDMFAHPKNKLDLFNELQRGKVILINTKAALLKKNLEPFGRYFIARLLQAAEERMFTDRGNRMPVYAYIDEASDYISNEENIEELKNKARKQKVALIIANQMESQIEMPLVREALSKMAIQCRGEPPMRRGDAPIWHIQLGKQAPVQVSFPNTQFSMLPRMSERHFQEMLAEMQDRYCSPVPDYSEEFGGHEPEEPQYQEPPKQGRAVPPKDDEYDDRYDILQQITLHPAKARSGTILTVKCPNGRQHQQSIPAGVHSGFRFVVKGASIIRRPDNRNGNFWVEIEVPQMSGSKNYAPPPEADETDAKPW